MEPNGRLIEEDEKSELLLSDPADLLPSPRSNERNAKVADIRKACTWKDITALRALATSEGGLVSDEVRRLACSCYRGSLLFQTDLRQGLCSLGIPIRRVT